MSVPKVLLLIVGGGVLGFVLSVSVGDRVAGRLSRVPLLKNYRIVSTQAPIVIQTTEEVRSRGDEDVLSALERSRQKVAAVLHRTEQGFVYAGGAVNLTSDGWFMTSKDLAEKNTESYIQLPDGNLRKVSRVYSDAASNVGFLQAEGKGSFSVAGFGDSTKLRSGERVLLVTAGLGADNPKSQVSFVSEKETQAKDAEAGYFNTRFSIQNIAGLFAGTAIVNMAGDFVGMWDGSKVVPASTMSKSSNLFISRKDVIARPVFGFAYYSYSSGEAESFGVTEGSVSVLRVAPNSPSSQAGLKVSDIISAVNGQKVVGGVEFDSLLLTAEPGKVMEFTIQRAGKELQLKVTPTAEL